MAAELLVFEDILIGLVADLVEVVHVELPDEGGKVAMAEVGRQDHLLKLVSIVDNECDSVRVPANDILVFAILNRNIRTSRI